MKKLKKEENQNFQQCWSRQKMKNVWKRSDSRFWEQQNKEENEESKENETKKRMNSKKAEHDSQRITRQEGWVEF